MSRDYSNTSNEEMSPKNDELMKNEPSNGGQNDENDLREIADVNSSLDELNLVMDTMEARADSIISQLIDLLNSNKEIRKNIKEEMTKNDSGDDNVKESME